ncbi:MAG: SCO6880 family protein [Acidimicrobiales bacterium]
MSIASPVEPRSYRFDPLDRSIVFGLGLSQLIVAGVTGAVWFVAVLARVPLIPVTLALGVPAAVALVPVRGQPLCSWAPVVVGWMTRGSRRWERPLHLLVPGEGSATGPALPPWLAGLEIIAAAAGWGAVRDRTAGTLTAIVPIAGNGFRTRSAAEREFLLSGWGAVFTAFSDTGAVEVTRLCWSDVSHPQPLDAHLGWAETQAGPNGLAESYRAFITAQSIVRHDQLVSVTVRARRQRNPAEVSRVTDELGLCVEALTDALTEAQLSTPGPLTPEEIAYALRSGLDPTTVAPGPRRHGSLAQRLGLVAVGEAGPMATKVTANHVEVDGSVHRTYWVASWPEHAQAADWFEPLLTGDDDPATSRTLTVIIEPITEERALRQAATDDVRLSSDTAAKAASGRRVSARHRQRQAAVLERESEIVSGAAGLRYAGLITLTCPSLAELNRAAAAHERRCHRYRVTLRMLWGRQDLALAAALPLGLGLSRSEPRG